MTSPFEIRHTPGNKTGSVPDHWDIYLKGQDDSLITCWDSEAMARECVRFLEEYPERQEARRA